MVLSITGLSSQMALNLVDRTRDKQMEVLRNDPLNDRAVQAFQERVGDIKTPKDFVQDYEVYSFVMRAFDLEDRMFGKGMIRKILESDPTDSTSLVNRLTDPRFGELHTTMSFFTKDGPREPNFDNPFWQKNIVNNYFDRVFVNENAAQNETVGTVLEFREEVAGIRTWYDVLKNPELTEFFQVALSLPKEVSSLDIDKQKEILDRKFDLTRLSSSEEREKLISKYVAISDVLNPNTQTATSTGIQVMEAAVAGYDSWQIINVSFGIAPISYSPASLYR